MLSHQFLKLVQNLPGTPFFPLVSNGKAEPRGSACDPPNKSCSKLLHLLSFTVNHNLNLITFFSPREDQKIAVGTQVTLCPLHRSERAYLKHSAPTLGD